MEASVGFKMSRDFWNLRPEGKPTRTLVSTGFHRVYGFFTSLDGEDVGQFQHIGGVFEDKEGPAPLVTEKCLQVFGWQGSSGVYRFLATPGKTCRQSTGCDIEILILLWG